MADWLASWDCLCLVWVAIHTKAPAQRVSKHAPPAASPTWQKYHKLRGTQCVQSVSVCMFTTLQSTWERLRRRNTKQPAPYFTHQIHTIAAIHATCTEIIYNRKCFFFVNEHDASGCLLSFYLLKWCWCCCCCFYGRCCCTFRNRSGCSFLFGQILNVCTSAFVQKAAALLAAIILRSANSMAMMGSTFARFHIT